MGDVGMLTAEVTTLMCRAACHKASSSCQGKCSTCPCEWTSCTGIEAWCGPSSCPHISSCHSPCICPHPHDPIPVLHRVVRWLRAMWRQGTHKAKRRGEVSGGGKKPWRQKGTGRARHGSIRSPIWVSLVHACIHVCARGKVGWCVWQGSGRGLHGFFLTHCFNTREDKVLPLCYSWFMPPCYSMVHNAQDPACAVP